MRGPLFRIWLAAGALGTGSVLGLGGVDVGVGIALLCAGSAAALARRAPRRAAVGMAIAALGLGVVSGTVRSSRTSAAADLARRVPRCQMQGRIVEQIGGLGTLTAAERLSCSGHDVVLDAGTVVIDAPQRDAGERVAAAGWLLPLRDSSFDRARAYAGADAYLDPDSIGSISAPKGLLAPAARIRAGLRRASGSLDPRAAGLIRGLAVGDTSLLDRATVENFRRSGLSHLLAVSGSNVAIVLGAVALALRRAALRTRLAGGSLALALFVLVVGPDASVLRAAVMAAIALVALASGRRAEPLHALGLALLGVIAARPAMALSVGLHLSAAATLGIVLWAEPLCDRSPLPRALSAPLAVTIAAQIGVAPVLVAAFGEVSLVAPVANLLAVPAVPPATVLGLAAGVVDPVVPAVGGLLARTAAPFTAWIAHVAQHAAALPWAAIDVPRWVGGVVGAPVAAAALVTVLRAGRNG